MNLPPTNQSIMNELQTKYINLLKEVDKSDTESTHISYDIILCNLLTELWYSEVVEEYEKTDKWYC